MDSIRNDPRRRWHGHKVHRDTTWDFSFYVPLAWKRYDLTDRYGVIYAPGEDPRTGFYVSVEDLSDKLDEPLAETDLTALHAGILEGIEKLPGYRVLHQKEISKESAFGLEIMLTFTLDDGLCKRRAFLLYKDRQQFTIYCQGWPASEYDVFHDMMGFMYTSFTFSDLLAQVKPRPGRSVG